MMTHGVQIRVHTHPPIAAGPSTAERVRRILGGFHAGVAGVALAAGVIILLQGETALGVAALGQALLVAVYFALVLVWLAVGEDDGGPDLTAAASAFQKQAAALVTLAGVVLALVIALPGDDSPTLTIKVAGAALVVSALAGLLLAGLVATGVGARAQYFLASIVYSASIWTLSFGLLCLATALVIER